MIKLNNKIIERGKGLIFSNRGWIKLTVIIFLFSFISGSFLYFFPSFNFSLFLIKAGFSDLSQISERMLDLSFPGQVFLIFQNNLFAASFMLFGGILLGILPAFAMIFNGLLLGYFFSLLAVSSLGIMEKAIIFLTFIPHAVIELGVIVIVASFGLRAGIEFLLPENENKRLKIFIANIKKCFYIIIFAILGLSLAAFVEIIDMKIAETLIK